MLRICLCLMACLLLFPTIPKAVDADERPFPLRAAFIKENQLWITTGSSEKKVTDGEHVRFPKWSHDGMWVAYLKGDNSTNVPTSKGELWLYNIQEDKHVRVATNITANFQWDPNQNRIGFLSVQDKDEEGFESKGRLFITDVRDLTKSQHITSKVSNFSWLPDSTGFIVSSKIEDRIDANIVLSKILINQSTKKFSPIHLYTISVEKDEYFIATSQFKWSNDGQWVTFLLTPTASISSDYNLLCVLSKDGKTFKKLAGMLEHEEWYQWAPTDTKLATIMGEGREAIKDKQLTIYNMLDDGSEVYTPSGFVDLDLTWVTDSQIITARSPETLWMNVEERPLPALFRTDLNTKEVTKLTSPSMREGDFRPQFVGSSLIWIRTDRHEAEVWIADLNRTKPKKWISNMNVGSYYYEKWNWDEVFDLYVESSLVSSLQTGA